MPRAHEEDAIQKAIVQYARWSLKPKHCIFAIPNGGYRLPREAARLVGLGVLAGVPDLCIMGPGGRCHLMEVKRPKGRLSKAQDVFIAFAIEAAIPYAVVHSLDEAMAAMKRWRVIR